MDGSTIKYQRDKHAWSGTFEDAGTDREIAQAIYDQLSAADQERLERGNNALTNYAGVALFTDTLDFLEFFYKLALYRMECIE